MQMMCLIWKLAMCNYKYMYLCKLLLQGVQKNFKMIKHLTSFLDTLVIDGLLWQFPSLIKWIIYVAIKRAKFLIWTAGTSALSRFINPQRVILINIAYHILRRECRCNYKLPFVDKVTLLDSQGYTLYLNNNKENMLFFIWKTFKFWRFLYCKNPKVSLRDAIIGNN